MWNCAEDDRSDALQGAAEPKAVCPYCPHSYRSQTCKKSRWTTSTLPTKGVFI